VAWEAAERWSRSSELQEAWARVAVGFEQLADQGDRLRENALMRSTKPINHRP